MKFLLVMLFSVGTATAADMYIPVQSGSFNGLLSSGIGLQSKNDWAAEVTAGWSPNPGGEETLQLNIKGSRFVTNNLYGGIGLLISADKDTFAILPDKYPDNYYSPTGYYLAPFIGLYNSGFFIELTTIDYYLAVKANNPNYINWAEVVSAGIGFRFELE
jgi:hypothetical protein